MVFQYINASKFSYLAATLQVGNIFPTGNFICFQLLFCIPPFKKSETGIHLYLHESSMTVITLELNSWPSLVWIAETHNIMDINLIWNKKKQS